MKAIFLDGPLKGQETEVLSSVPHYEGVSGDLNDSWFHSYRVAYPDRDGVRQLGYDHSWRLVSGVKEKKVLR